MSHIFKKEKKQQACVCVLWLSMWLLLIWQFNSIDYVIDKSF